MADPGPDQPLIERSIAGDREAFSELVRRHERRVYAIALRLLGREEDALDAAQDTFLTVFRKLEQFRGDAAFTTWLHRIAVNASYDILRARARQPALHLVGDDDREHEPGPPVEDHAGDVAGGLDVQRALQLVPPDYRAVLVLADVHDLPYERIAEILEIAVGTVKSRAFRGRVALAKAMGLDHARGAAREPVRSPRPSEEDV